MINVLLYSNCAGRVIATMFKRHIYTKDKFTINYIVNYQNVLDNKQLDLLHKQMLENCDIFMYQPFNKHYTHSEYDISNLIKYLKPSCIILKLNYYRFKGFWFESEYKPYESYNNYHFSDMKYYGLHNSFINFNGDKKDIVDKIDSIHIDREKFLTYFRDELDNLKKIDDNSDVKMYDYFINNYKTKQLFNDVFHPTNLFLYEVFRQVVFKLTGHDLIFEDMDFINKCNDMEMTHFALPILPSIKQLLDIATPDVICVFNQGNRIYMNIYDYYYIRLSQTNFQNYLNE